MVRNKKPRRLTPILSCKIPIVFKQFNFEYLDETLSPKHKAIIRRDRLSPIQFNNRISRGIKPSSLKKTKKEVRNKYRKKVFVYGDNGVFSTLKLG